MIIKIGIIALIAMILIPAGAMAICSQGFGMVYGFSDPSVRLVETGNLAPEETHWLQYMREEEKLARDVYLHEYSVWNLRIFSCMFMAEQQHMNSIKTLLDRYSLADPAAGNPPGKFSDPFLQRLYNDLIFQGDISGRGALNAGIIVEKTNIADLKTGFDSAKHNDIRQLYSRLIAASSRHLYALENLAGH